MAAAHWVVFIDSYYGKLLSFWWFNVGSHFTRPRSLYTAGDISKIKTTNSFINMLLPVQLSLPLSSKLDQRKVRNDTPYLFLNSFYVCSVNKLPFPNCKEAHWVSKRPVKDFFSGRMARTRSQNDNSGPKGRWSELHSPGCIHDRQHWRKHYCSPEKPQFIRKLNFMMK